MAQQGKRLNDEIRALIIAALMAGEQVSEIAQRYEVSKTTVSRLKRHIPKERLEQLVTEKEVNLGALIVRHVETTYATIDAILGELARPERLQKESTEGLVRAFGELRDSGQRILEAIAPDEAE